jgi:hypothetical protein
MACTPVIVCCWRTGLLHVIPHFLTSTTRWTILIVAPAEDAIYLSLDEAV